MSAGGLDATAAVHPNDDGRIDDAPVPNFKLMCRTYVPDWRPSVDLRARGLCRGVVLEEHVDAHAGQQRRQPVEIDDRLEHLDVVRDGAVRASRCVGVDSDWAIELTRPSKSWSG